MLHRVTAPGEKDYERHRKHRDDQTGEVGSVCEWPERVRGGPGGFRTDPVEATVPGHPLDDTEDGDRRAGGDHRPGRAAKLRASAIRVGADKKERGHRSQLERQTPGRAWMELPAGKHGLEREQPEEQRGRKPAGGQLDPKLPVTQVADDPGDDHAENDELGDGLRPGLHSAEGKGREHDQEQHARLDDAFVDGRGRHWRVTSSSHTLPLRFPSGSSVGSRRTFTLTTLVLAGMVTGVSRRTQSLVVPLIVWVSARDCSRIPGTTTWSLTPERVVNSVALANARSR